MEPRDFDFISLVPVTTMMLMRDQSSLFRRVTRSALSGYSDQRENRLTEVFASTIEAVDGLGLHLAIEWLKTSAHNDSYVRSEEREICLGEKNSETLERLYAYAKANKGGQPAIEVQTQKPVRNKFVDLELRFRAGDDSLEVVRVEIKLASQVHSRQLFEYACSGELAAGLAKADTALVLLAPAGAVPQSIGADDQIPIDLPQCSWAATGRVAREFGRKRFGDSFPDGVGSESSAGAFLLAQFIRYLREESLMHKLDVVGSRHIEAVADYEAAAGALGYVLNEAVGVVNMDGRWGVGSIDRDRLDQADWYCQFQVEEAEGTVQWLEFKIARAGNIEGNSTADSLDANTLVAIAGWSTKNELGTEAPIGTDEHIRFREGSCIRVMRMRPLAELLSEDSSREGSDLDSQGQYLGEWVKESFEGLRVDE